MMNPDQIVRRFLASFEDRQAMEFPTEEARAKYLKDHPGADKSRHTVQKDDKGGKTERNSPPLRREEPEFSDRESPLYLDMKDPVLKSLGDDYQYWDRDKVEDAKRKLKTKIENTSFKEGSPEEKKVQRLNKTYNMLGNFLRHTMDEDR